MKTWIERHSNGEIIVNPDLPEDLQVAIKSFVLHAHHIEEFGCDFGLHQYLENLLDTLKKYPRFDGMVAELVQAAGKPL